MASDDLFRGQLEASDEIYRTYWGHFLVWSKYWSMIWPWRSVSFIMILTKPEGSDECHGNRNISTSSHWLIMGRSQKWHDLRSQTSKFKTKCGRNGWSHHNMWVWSLSVIYFGLDGKTKLPKSSQNAIGGEVTQCDLVAWSCGTWV